MIRKAAMSPGIRATDTTLMLLLCDALHLSETLSSAQGQQSKELKFRH